ncbi:DUF5692 family protein [Arcanobacterium phocae]|uniref:DUF5692 family protein n=1 Tax=Arcanobacterium phocae TaxID=131112 RepID=UPI001C0EC369|nr:DUF5692 family protein [Arcanobacterium phocae]
MSSLFTIVPPDYPALFFFEVGEWYDYIALILTTVALAVGAWLIIHYKWAIVLFFIILPITLGIFWWPYSTAGTTTAGWFPAVKHYSALLGSLSLVGIQLVPRLRNNRWYLLFPPILLAGNILEAVVRDIQGYWVQGIDPYQGGMVNWGGSWNIMNAIAGVLNLLAISGWLGIFVSKNRDKTVIWGDLTIWWIIGYDLWNFAFVYNCISDHAWYSGVALLASCTVPAFMKMGRGAWIQYRSYTLTLWTGFVLTVPTFTNASIFEHQSSHNGTALFLVSLAALVCNAGVFLYHIYFCVSRRRNPARQEVYFDTAEYQKLIATHATVETQAQIQDRVSKTTGKRQL